jgi:hypothetical protein
VWQWARLRSDKGHVIARQSRSIVRHEHVAHEGLEQRKPCTVGVVLEQTRLACSRQCMGGVENRGGQIEAADKATPDVHPVSATGRLSAQDMRAYSPVVARRWCSGKPPQSRTTHANHPCRSIDHSWESYAAQESHGVKHLCQPLPSGIQTRLGDSPNGWRTAVRRGVPCLWGVNRRTENTWNTTASRRPGESQH